MEIKQQLKEKVTTNTRSKNKIKAKQETKNKTKLMNILRENKELLTVTE